MGWALHSSSVPKAGQNLLEDSGGCAQGAQAWGKSVGLQKLLSAYTKGQPSPTRGHGNLQALGHMPWKKGRHRRATAMKFLSKWPGLYCNRTWDGWACWDDTPAGTLAEQHCPDYFPDFDVEGRVFLFGLCFAMNL